MLLVKAMRCVRKFPKEAWAFFVNPLFSSGQILTFMTACIGLFIILQTASVGDRDMQATQWAVSVQAFGFALIGWAIISMICAPFVTVKKDRERGFWSGNRFVYKVPLLVQTIRCRATGNTEMYKVRFDDAEPGSYVDFHIDLESGGHLAEIGIGSTFLTGPIPYKNWPGTGSMMLSADKTAVVQINLPTEALPITARVYCRSFSIGEGIDGDVGNHKFTV